MQALKESFIEELKTEHGWNIDEEGRKDLDVVFKKLGITLVPLSYREELLIVERDGAVSLLLDVQKECIDHRLNLKTLASGILNMDKVARSQGLYVGMGIDDQKSDTREEQQGPLWTALLNKAKELMWLVNQ